MFYKHLATLRVEKKTKTHLSKLRTKDRNQLLNFLMLRPYFSEVVVLPRFHIPLQLSSASRRVSKDLSGIQWRTGPSPCAAGWAMAIWDYQSADAIDTCLLRHWNLFGDCLCLIKPYKTIIGSSVFLGRHLLGAGRRGPCRKRCQWCLTSSRHLVNSAVRACVCIYIYINICIHITCKYCMCIYIDVNILYISTYTAVDRILDMKKRLARRS